MRRTSTALASARGQRAAAEGWDMVAGPHSEGSPMADDKGRGSKGPESRRMSLIFAASFVVFLAVAIFASLLGKQWSDWLPGTGRHTSMLEGVRGAVYDVMPFLM